MTCCHITKLLQENQTVNVFNSVILARNRQLPDDDRMIETCLSIFIYLFFFYSTPPHVLMNFRGFSPGCGDSVADFWGWDAHGAMLSWWCEWWYAGRWNTRRGLKPKSTNYPDHGHHDNLSLQGKIPMAEPGIEPETSWLVARDPDHYTTRLITLKICKI